MKHLYVTADTTPFYIAENTNDFEYKLIFGDEVTTTGFDPGDARTEAAWRGRTGWVRSEDLTEDAMLEVYFLDVGQGDATFIVTPQRTTIMVDGGRSLHALQFLMWKYRLDLPDTPNARVDLLVLSHGDSDHIEGLTRLLEHSRVDVGKVIHSGVTSFSSAAGKDTRLGDVVQVDGETFLKERHDDLPDLKTYDETHLSNAFRSWRTALVAKNPAYEAVDSTMGVILNEDQGFSLRVVAPVLEHPGGAQEGLLRSYGSESHTINGHSVVLGAQHGDVKFLFTGDVNHKAGHVLVSNAQVVDHLDAHVLKAPHHGSHEFDLDFLRAIHPQITVVSSGEEPDYGHPRANFLGTIGKVSRGEPLLFSTELAATFKETSVESDDALVAALDLNDPGAIGAARWLWMKRLSGIINVRSDGEKLFAARRVTQHWQWNTYDVEPADREF